MFFTDKAWFHLDGFVNVKIIAFGHRRIFENIGKEVCTFKTLMCGVLFLTGALWGPFFFERTVTAEVYRGIVMQFISLLEPDKRDCIFQQDGATARTAQETIAFLKDFFGNHLISHPLLPLRSPDLSPPNFFLWGCLKERVFATCPSDLNEL